MKPLIFFKKRGNFIGNLDKGILGVPRVKLPQVDRCHVVFLRLDVFVRCCGQIQTVDGGERQPTAKKCRG